MQLLKQFFVVPKDEYLKCQKESGWHWIDLSDGLILLSGNVTTCGEAELLRVGGKPLPHAMSGETVKTHPHFAYLQKHLGAEETDTTFMLAEKARKIHPLMRY